MYDELSGCFYFPIFLFHYFHIKKKNEFILLSGIVQLFILTFLSFYSHNNIVLPLIIISFNILLFYFINDKITLENIFITIAYEFIIFSTRMIGLIVKDMMVSFQIINLNIHIEYVLECLIGKTVLICMTILFIKLKDSFSISLELSQWKLIVFFESILMFLIVMIGYLLSLSEWSFQIFYVLLLGLIILNDVFILIILKINHFNNEYLEYVKAHQFRQYNDEKMALIKNMKNEMDAIDHRLFYVIFHIDHLLENHEVDKAQQILQQYKSVLIKQNMIIHTGNVIFDCLLSLKINDLIIHNMKVKTCLFISQHEVYDQFMFIDFLTKLLDYFHLCQELELYMYEHASYIIFKILYDSDHFDSHECDDFLSTHITQFDGRYVFKETTHQIKILISKDCLI